MKKIFLMLIACVSVIMTGCDKGNGGDDTPSTKGKIKYEATVSDPTNYKIAIGYMDGVTTELKQIEVESPFTFELDAKYGTYLYCSVRAEPKNPLVTPQKSVTVKMFVDNKLLKEDSDEIAAVVQYLFGQDK